MREVKIPVEFLVMIADPAAPKRESAWQLSVAECFDREDGSPIVEMKRTTYNMAQAGEAGFSLPSIAKEFNEAIVAERDAAMKDAANAKEQIDTLAEQLTNANAAAAMLQNQVNTLAVQILALMQPESSETAQEG